MKTSTRKTLCIICLVICAVLWLFAPFVAINIITMGDQPSALEFVADSDEVLYIGERTEDPIFWVAIASIIGIAVCLICTLANKPLVVRVVAIIVEVLLLWILIRLFIWIEGEMEYFFEMFGFGYWGMLILLLIVALLSGKSSNTTPTTPELQQPAE